MWRIALLLLSIVPATLCQNADAGREESKAMPEPALPHYEWKACPFEGCAYRHWTARNSITVYDIWKQDRRAVARISKGEEVTGITGVVITFRPGVIRIDRDLPEQGLSAGEKILTYAYRGEGFSAVWFKGRYYPEFDISFTKWPDGSGCGGSHCAATYLDIGKNVWWAKVKLKSGRTGWVDMEHAHFSDTDLLSKNNDPTLRPRRLPRNANAGNGRGLG
jgi:hypothetical protein